LKIEGINPIHIKSSTELTKLKFYNRKKLFMGEQNKYLSDHINENVINLSRVNSIFLIVFDCKIQELYQNYYQTYTYPERIGKFSF